MFGGKRIIFYELNEVSLRVFRWFADAHPKSAIARMMANGQVIETVTEDEGHLSPWSSWPTLHRGVTDTKHTIFDFGQNLRDINVEYPPIWDLLTRGGRKVGLFGSFHTHPVPANVAEGYDFYVPDTFAAGPECFPAELEAFQSFNLAMVDRGGRNVNAGIAMKEAGRFLAAAPGLGLRGVTAMKLARQLVAERIRPERVVRRRTSQIHIAFDFFLKELRAKTPDVSFFFTNHVASAMHRYWPALFPKDYNNRFWTDQWEQSWKGEIEFALGEASAQIGDLMRFVERDPRYVLAVTTSMGQAAIEQKDVIRTQLYFTDLRRFMRLLGFADDEWRRERAMEPRYTVAIVPQLAEVFVERLNAFSIGGTAAHAQPRGHGVFCVEMGQPNLDPGTLDIRYRDKPLTLEQAGLSNVDIQDETGSYAYHIPQGSLLIYDPAKAKMAQPAAPLSTVQIAPSILANFGLERPRHMVDPAGPLSPAREAH